MRLIVNEPEGWSEAVKKDENEPRGCARLGAATKGCLRSTYFWANMLYLGYTIQALAVDYCSVIHPNLPFQPPMPPRPPLAAPPFPPPSATTDYATTTSSTSTTSDYNATSDYASSDYNATTSSSDYDYYDYGAYLAPLCSAQGWSPINEQYVALAGVHVISALVYFFAWYPYFRDHPELSVRMRVGLLAPDVLNFVEAIIYLKGSTRYAPNSLDPKCDTHGTPPGSWACRAYMELHYDEMSASIVELFASVGYCWVWWTIHERRPGRGMTVWDLDAWCQLFLVASSLVYFYYYVDVTAKPNRYATNFEYKTADTMYFVGALMYVAAEMRDQDFFFWLPSLPRFLGGDAPPATYAQLPPLDQAPAAKAEAPAEAEAEEGALFPVLLSMPSEVRRGSGLLAEAGTPPESPRSPR